MKINEILEDELKNQCLSKEKLKLYKRINFSDISLLKVYSSLYGKDGIKRYGVDGNVYCDCPFHPVNNKSTLCINDGKKLYYCRTCHMGGSISNFVQHALRLSNDDALNVLESRITKSTDNLSERGLKLYNKIFKNYDSIELPKESKMTVCYSDQEVIKGEKSIFLAGPTPRSKEIETWRKKACKILEEFGFDGVVYVPEYSNFGPLEDYLKQVYWEREALSNASVILFWVARELPDMPAFTTNVEFGYWLHSGKVIYGRPDDACNKGYLDWLYEEDTHKEPFNELEDLLLEAVVQANIKGSNTQNEILPLEKRKMMKIGNNR